MLQEVGVRVHERHIILGSEGPFLTLMCCLVKPLRIPRRPLYICIMYMFMY